MYSVCIYLGRTGQLELMSLEDGKIQREKGVVLLAQNSSLAGGNGAVHPVNALTSVLDIAHGGVDAGHVVEKGQQQDKDFLKVGSCPGTLEDHVGFPVELERHVQVSRLASSDAFAVVAQAQVVEQNGCQPSLALLGEKVHTVVVVGGKVKGIIVDHEQRRLVVQSRGGNVLARASARNCDASDGHIVALFFGFLGGGLSSGASSGCSRSSGDSLSSSSSSSLLGRLGGRGGRTRLDKLGLLETTLQAANGSAESSCGRGVVAFTQTGHCVVVQVQNVFDGLNR